MRIRLFNAILALLVCVIAAPANDPIVIKDSEAIQYVGKEVEVRGRVVSVTSSPLGTAFINFGGEYPNQTFAGLFRPGPQLRPISDLPCSKGKPSASPAQLNFTKGSRKSTSCRQVRSKFWVLRANGEECSLAETFPRRFYQSQVHFQQYGSGCRMWVPVEVKDPVLEHHPTRKSVGYFGAVRIHPYGEPITATRATSAAPRLQ